MARVEAAGGAQAGLPSLHLVGNGRPPCAVGDFSAGLHASLHGYVPTPPAILILEPGRLALPVQWRAVGSASAVVANLPVVAWKRALLGPVAAYGIALLRGRPRITVLHEWAGLHALRRLVLRPLILLSSRVVLLSPQIRDELAADRLVGFRARSSALMPLPPTLARPTASVDSALRRRLVAARGEGRLVLGHFGSIYPGKQPEGILEVAAALKRRGERPLTVFLGSFVKAFDGVEAAFRERVAALDLSDDVIVSGYVATTPELFGLFEAVDAFLYRLPEGLTARRTSVLACLQSGRPVVVSAPARLTEFDHHPRFRALLDGAGLALVPRGADAEACATRILQVRDRPSMLSEIDAAQWFGDTAEALRALLPGRC